MVVAFSFERLCGSAHSGYLQHRALLCFFLGDLVVSRVATSSFSVFRKEKIVILCPCHLLSYLLRWAWQSCWKYFVSCHPCAFSRTFQNAFPFKVSSPSGLDHTPTLLTLESAVTWQDPRSLLSSSWQETMMWASSWGPRGIALPLGRLHVGRVYLFCLVLLQNC